MKIVKVCGWVVAKKVKKEKTKRSQSITCKSYIFFTFCCLMSKLIQAWDECHLKIVLWVSEDRVIKQSLEGIEHFYLWPQSLVWHLKAALTLTRIDLKKKIWNFHLAQSPDLAISVFANIGLLRKWHFLIGSYGQFYFFPRRGPLMFMSSLK